MAAQAVPSLDFSIPIVEPGSGCLTTYGDAVLRSLINRTGGQSDKIEAAHVIASAAVPKVTEVVGSGGLQTGGALVGNIGLSLYVAVGDAASLPTAGLSEGDWAYALNGCKSGEASGSGTGTPVWLSAGYWYAVWSGLGVTT